MPENLVAGNEQMAQTGYCFCRFFKFAYNTLVFGTRIGTVPDVVN
jgi:hypothetical protein